MRPKKNGGRFARDRTSVQWSHYLVLLLLHMHKISYMGYEKGTNINTLLQNEHKTAKIKKHRAPRIICITYIYGRMVMPSPYDKETLLHSLAQGQDNDEKIDEKIHEWIGAKEYAYQ